MIKIASSAFFIVVAAILLAIVAGPLDVPQFLGGVGDSEGPVIVEDSGGTAGDEEVIVEEVEVFEKNAGEEVLDEVEAVVKKVLSPGPLRAPGVEPSRDLSELGVFVWTNTYRLSNGIPALSQSPLLDEVAEAKLQDMFELQYFAHESPEGGGVGDIAKNVGYRFILIGENLALGDFKGDKSLVDAWMASPGHRANILEEKYQEIGVAVGKGEFEGRTTWLAVQSFGLPVSACGEVDEDLRRAIDRRIAELEELEEDITAARAEVQSTFPKRGPAYQERVDAYNALANEYNALLAELNTWIAAYNGQVNLFNACLDGI